MQLLMILVIVVYVGIRVGLIQMNPGGSKKRAAQTGKKAAPSKPDPSPIPRPVYAQKHDPRQSTNRIPPQSPKQAAQWKREQMKETAKWREAKKQQDDAEQLHSVRVDSCEGRLESLKVLFEAGILDREEYNQRVARTKARHAQGLMDG